MWSWRGFVLSFVGGWWPCDLVHEATWEHTKFACLKPQYWRIFVAILSVLWLTKTSICPRQSKETGNWMMGHPGISEQLWVGDLCVISLQEPIPTGGGGMWCWFSWDDSSTKLESTWCKCQLPTFIYFYHVSKKWAFLRARGGPCQVLDFKCKISEHIWFI